MKSNSYAKLPVGSDYAQPAGGMRRFFNRNIGYGSRLARGVAGTILLIVGIILADFELWLCLVLVALGLFGLFEAARGWCPGRGLGKKTKF